MQDLFVVRNKQAERIVRAIGAESKSPTSDIRSRSLNPTKAGRIYGTFMPSKTGSIKVRKMDGSIVVMPMNRKDRRRLRRRSHAK